MKKLIVLVFIISGVSANSQSLKDALYGGKLRLDSGTVIRKGEDLSTRIDTSTRKPPAPQNKVVIVDSSNSDTIMVVADSIVINANPTVTGTDGTKDNNKIWKDYMEEFTGTLKTEVMTSKKIKPGSYSVLIDYVIETDGSITVNSVSASPSSEYLEQQIKNRLTLTTPQMTPLLSANGKPRKAGKKYTFMVMKN